MIGGRDATIVFPANGPRDSIIVFPANRAQRGRSMHRFVIGSLRPYTRRTAAPRIHNGITPMIGMCDSIVVFPAIGAQRRCHGR